MGLRQFWSLGADADYMTGLQEARLKHSHPLAHLLLLFVAVFTVAFFYWAKNAPIEVVTRGMGRVIPSSHIQIIQNLEGGILSELLVAEGDTVEKNQVILRIDDTSFSADYRDRQSLRASYLASIARLSAESKDGGILQFPAEIEKNHPTLARTETALYHSRQETLNSSLLFLEKSYRHAYNEHLALSATITRLSAEAVDSVPIFSKEIKKEQPVLAKAEMALFRSRHKTLRQNLRTLKRTLLMAQKELMLNKPLVREGVVSEIEVLRLEREVNNLEGKISELENQFRSDAAEELNQNKTRLFRMQREVNELKGGIDERTKIFRTKAQTELNEIKNKLARVEETIVTMKDRVTRTHVKAPVRGIVKTVNITTIGGVIRPGQNILEIVPLDGTLLIEARIRPTDIAFLYPGQKSTVKVTAYDYTIYGGLVGTLEHISADTITDERGETFYLIRVRTDKNYLGSSEKPLPVISGMTTSVDILTGNKTVLEYLLKPLTRARHEALRER